MVIQFNVMEENIFYIRMYNLNATDKIEDPKQSVRKKKQILFAISIIIILNTILHQRQIAAFRKP